MALRSSRNMKTPLDEIEFTALDTELTGLDLRRDSIISVGAVRMRGASILPGQTFYRLVRPSSELRREGVSVHELTHSDLESAAEIADVLDELIEFIGENVLLGHFIHIDTGFISRAMKSAFGVALQSPSVDTAAVHEWLTDNEPRFAQHHGGVSVRSDLSSLAERYGIDVLRAHDALYDAYVAAQLFQKMAHFLRESGVRTLKELLSIGKL